MANNRHTIKLLSGLSSPSTQNSPEILTLNKEVGKEVVRVEGGGGGYTSGGYLITGSKLSYGPRTERSRLIRGLHAESNVASFDIVNNVFKPDQLDERFVVAVWDKSTLARCVCCLGNLGLEANVLFFYPLLGRKRHSERA